MLTIPGAGAICGFESIFIGAAPPPTAFTSTCTLIASSRWKRTYTAARVSVFCSSRSSTSQGSKHAVAGTDLVVVGDQVDGGDVDAAGVLESPDRADDLHVLPDTEKTREKKRLHFRNGGGNALPPRMGGGGGEVAHVHCSFLRICSSDSSPDDQTIASIVAVPAATGTHDQQSCSKAARRQRSARISGADRPTDIQIYRHTPHYHTPSPHTGTPDINTVHTDNSAKR